MSQISNINHDHNYSNYLCDKIGDATQGSKLPLVRTRHFSLQERKAGTRSVSAFTHFEATKEAMREKRSDHLLQGDVSTTCKTRCRSKECLNFHEDYLRQRMKESGHGVSGVRLFREIQARGYRGSIEAMRNLLGMIRAGASLPEARLAFHKGYLRQRIKQSRHLISGPQLFKEIRAKGYRGSLNTVQNFVGQVLKNELPAFTHFEATKEAMREKRSDRLQGDVSTTCKTRCRSKECLNFHGDYLRQRMRESGHGASGVRLFREIQARGYRGSIEAMRNLLRVIRTSESLPEACLAFHKGYLRQRIKQSRHFISGPQLFKEIRAKGYRGSPNTVQNFVGQVRKNELPAEVSLSFHKNYLIERIAKAESNIVSASELFREIRAKGYRGSLRHVQTFISAIIQRDQGALAARLGFHKDYLIKRLEKDRVPASLLFKEIQDRGYRGSLRHMQTFISMIRRDWRTSILDSYQGYLRKRREETESHPVSVTELFREIRAQGYRGSLRTVHAFMAAINFPKKDLSVHKQYLAKRIEEMQPNHISVNDLFKEIQAKGYRGAIKTVHNFVTMVCKNQKS